MDTTTALIYASVFVFLLGAIIGSLLNVCILRLPLEKSALWPGSRCGRCLTPLSAWEKLPIIGYWLVAGRCRHCGVSLSARYWVVELFAALGFLGLFWVEIALNWQEIAFLKDQPFRLGTGPFPWQHLVMFGHHALLFCLLTVAALIDLDHKQIPLGLTIAGTAVGLVLATAFPWPWPSLPVQALPRPSAIAGDTPEAAWQLASQGTTIGHGLYLWPVWGPLPKWLPAGSWQLGLATGLAGALAGSLLVRVLKFLSEKALGREALGLGDADLMMLAGAFLGWQPMVATFFLGAVVALFLALPLKALNRDGDDPTLPFGPGLALGALLAWLGWRFIGPKFQLLYFDGTLLLIAILAGGAIVYLAIWLLGRLRRPA